MSTVSHTQPVWTSGTTVAVLANGLDKIYPASYTQLARRILEQDGSIMLEISSKIRPLGNNQWSLK